MDDDVEDGQEAQAHVAKVDGHVLVLHLHGRVELLRHALEVKLLRVFLMQQQQQTRQNVSRCTDHTLARTEKKKGLQSKVWNES